jgi:hypothetical protein
MPRSYTPKSTHIIHVLSCDIQVEREVTSSSCTPASQPASSSKPQPQTSTTRVNPSATNITTSRHQQNQLHLHMDKATMAEPTQKTDIKPEASDSSTNATAPPEKASAIWTRRFIIFAFWAVVATLGLPHWIWTTSIHREELPVGEMARWAEGNVRCFHLSFAGKTVYTSRMLTSSV